MEKQEKLPILVIKPDFEWKLRELKILTKFKKNCINSGFKHGLEKRIKQNETPNWYHFIECSFVWVYSPEGHKYWNEIANYDRNRNI